MFALGKLYIDHYRLWITTPVFEVSPLHMNADKLGYYEVILSTSETIKLDDESTFDSETYVNLAKTRHRDIIGIDDKGMPKPGADQNQITSYMQRKESNMPCYKLLRKNVEVLIDRLMHGEC